MQCTEAQGKNLLVLSTSGSQYIDEKDMKKKKINQWHITQDEFGEIHC